MTLYQFIGRKLVNVFGSKSIDSDAGEKNESSEHKFEAVGEFLGGKVGNGLLHESLDDMNGEKYVIIEDPNNADGEEVYGLGTEDVEQIINEMDAVPVFNTSDMAEMYAEEWTDDEESYIPVFVSEGVPFDTHYMSITERYHWDSENTENKEMMGTKP